MEHQSVKAQVMHVETFPGRVLVGPKKLGRIFVRIVSQRNGSGLIERYDQASSAWFPAPPTITFGDVWSAPDVPKLIWAELSPESAPESRSEPAKSRHRKPDR